MKYLFLYAHLDDKTILSYGTMLRFAQDNSIYVVVMRGEGRNVIVAQNIEMQKARILAFSQNCQSFIFYASI